MAPKGGRGGSSGSSSGSSSSSSSSSCGGDYPCSSEMRYLYGNRGTSLYSEAEMYGQLVVYIIWALILVGLLVKSWKSKTRVWLLQSAMFSFVCALAFLCARFGAMVADASVPIGYRFESAIVDMTWRAGLVLLSATLIHYTKAWKPLRLGFWAVWLIFAALSIAYVVLSFVLAGYGLNHFKEDWRWHISDRDFAQTLSNAAVDRLKRNGSIGLVFSYIQSLVWDIIDDGYAHSRDIQIKLGLAADIIAFLLGLALIVPAAFAWLKKSHGLKSTILALTAAFGLVLATLFELIVSAAFVLPNWRVVTNFDNWEEWRLSSVPIEGQAPAYEVIPGFLPGYRTAVNGFPVVQAVIPPLGLMVACAAMLLYKQIDIKSGRQETATEDKAPPPYAAPPVEYYPANKT